ncbi:hypothetical protein PV08_01475 [Exophiala spinifera]|uniref:Uncharacterized protein n=1 Tax=Exophiala spinifera TaxID=91928 RepID=A0A0D1Z003_9EURO|nr:uncharacterized protein PV08_01475 [Exophiala spinifera]KIW20896.1 hypothetical protein PV08_01475 [Exophiala spinifera]
MALRDEPGSERPLILSRYRHGDLDLDALIQRVDKYAAQVEAVEAGMKQMRPFSLESVEEKSNRRPWFKAKEGDMSAGTSPVKKDHGSSRASSSSYESIPCPSDESMADHVIGTELGEHKGHPVELKHISQIHNSVYLKPSRCQTCGKRRAPKPFEASLEQANGLPHWKEPQSPTSQEASFPQYLVLPQQPPTPRLHSSRRSSRAGELRGEIGYNAHGPEVEEYFTDSEADEPKLQARDPAHREMMPSWPFPPENSTGFGAAQPVPNPNLSPRAVKVHSWNHAEGPPKRKESLAVNCTAPLPKNQERSSPVPPLSHSGSLATVATLSPPPTPILMCSPYEDQLRRELEIQVLHEGPEALESKYKLGGPLTLNVVDDYDDDGNDQGEVGGQTPEKTTMSTWALPKDNGRLQLKRSETILGIFRKRSPLEKFIDMYLEEDDDPEEDKTPRRARSMRPWRWSPGQLKATNTPPVPPLLQANHEQPSG